ncbi:alpha/beta hydrolase, partial [bacterium]|nr:alpha/beta hydrolase [bacterium]
AGPEPDVSADLSAPPTGIRVSQAERWISIEPAEAVTKTGFIFYPGGRVDARSYYPALVEIASKGFMVVVVKMPFSLAVFAPERGLEVMAAYPAVEQWVIGGHSLGGAMAANFAFNHPESVEGLVLWAAYPTASSSLTDRQILVTSIYGSEDGLATLEDIEASRSLLPAGTLWVEIKGGNHAGFGSYGLQAGDGKATITAAEQRAQVVGATVDLLNQVEGRR